MTTNLTRRGANANNAARLPALPDSQAVTDPQVRNRLELIREWLEVRLGARGDYYERAVTFRDLEPALTEINRRLTALEAARGVPVFPQDQARQIQSILSRLDQLNRQDILNYNNASTEILQVINQVQGVATQDVVLFARDMLPSATGGCSALTVIEFDAAQPNFHALMFDPTTSESADVHTLLPTAWAGKMFKVYVYWGHGNGAADFGVKWEIAANSAGDNETVILDFTPGVPVIDEGGTAGNLYIGELSAAVPISSNYNHDGDLVSLRITRRVDDAEDTLDIDAALLAIRITLTDAPFPVGECDPYWNNVILLVQGGADASLVIQDLSDYADSVTITNYAEFDSDKQRFGHNSIATATASAAIPAFTSSGYASRFARTARGKTTIECWVYIGSTVAVTGPFFFAWWQDGGRILEVGATTGGALRLRNGDDAAISSATLSTDAWHFLQLNIDAGAYTLDVDGTVAYSGTNSYSADSAGTFSFFVAAQTSVGSATAASEVWVGPMRVTRGVLRARGSVPTEALPAIACAGGSAEAAVAVLMHFEGNFTDSSDAPNTFTAQGSAVTSSTRSKFGTESFIGNGTMYVTCPDQTLFNLSSYRVWSIDFWVYVPTATTLATDNCVISSWNSGGNLAWYVGLDSTNRVYILRSSDGTAVTGPTVMSTAIGRDAWKHIAVWVSPTHGDIRCAVDGVVGTITAQTSVFNGNASLSIGATAAATAKFPTGMSIDELRVCVDTIDYDYDSFTPPAAPYA